MLLFDMYIWIIIFLFTRDLETDKMDVTAMLTKFARASTSNGVKMYNSRKPLT